MIKEKPRSFLGKKAKEDMNLSDPSLFFDPARSPIKQTFLKYILGYAGMIRPKGGIL